MQLRSTQLKRPNFDLRATARDSTLAIQALRIFYQVCVAAIYDMEKFRPCPQQRCEIMEKDGTGGETEKEYGRTSTKASNLWREVFGCTAALFIDVNTLHYWNHDVTLSKCITYGKIFT